MILTRITRESIERLGGHERAIWDLLVVPLTLPDLIERLTRLLGVQGEAIATDVKASLDVLLSKQLLEGIIETDV